MKKLVAALLAVLLTVGVCAVSVVAEEPSGGTTYLLTQLVRPLVVNNDADKNVTVLKPGDIVSFGAKTKKLEIFYYPDALNLPYTSIKNNTWKAYVDSLGTVTTFASSPNKYKDFYHIETYTTATSLSYTIAGLNSEDYKFSARDSSGYVWTVAPIDYSLKFANGNDAEFLGWIVEKLTNSSSGSTLYLHAYWDRSKSGETTTTTTQPAETTNPDDENKSDIMKTLDKFFGLFAENNGYDTSDWRSYLSFVPKLPAVLFGLIATYLGMESTADKIYDFFGIVVE